MESRFLPRRGARSAVTALVAALALTAACAARTPGGGGSAGSEYGGYGQANPPAATAGGGREVEVELDNYYFEPATVELKQGETVTLKLVNESGAPHTFTVKDLAIDVTVPARETRTVTVRAERAGEFSLVCSYHERSGMTGKVVVRP